MKDNFFQQLYSGLLRFSTFKKQLSSKTNLKDLFPKVGFVPIEKIKQLEKNLEIDISSQEIFEQALTHRSYLQVISRRDLYTNERLEFLGDSILGMVVAEYLFSIHTHLPEGDLTKMRSWLVNKNSLALCARKLCLHDFLLMSHSAARSLENGSDSILADALEAIIGAIYFDSGIDSAKDFIVRTLLPIVMEIGVMVDTNYKSILLEHVQAEGKTAPHYIVMEETGPDHDKEFRVAVFVDDSMLGKGAGKSKKQAEQLAARNALANLDVTFQDSDGNYRNQENGIVQSHHKGEEKEKNPVIQ